jgi:uncharacterized protein (DUF2141 family)
MCIKVSRFLLIVMAIALTACAKRGTITGGPKDTLAPVVIQSLPKNYNTNFKGKEFKLYFDEYIKLKDVNKQLVISPPMTIAPEVTPTAASKFISVRINDTLQPNTTYSFNFGNSIQDNNEGNALPQYKYVFSTGNYIDSLTIEGSIKHAREYEVDNFVNVMLYEINESYTDSAFYKQKPRYLTNTLDSSRTFKIENIKAGRYQLVALKDVKPNYVLDPKTDKLAFWSEPVDIPTDKSYELKLFTEIPGFKSFKPSQAAGGRLLMGYEGDPKGITAVVRNGTDIIPAVVTKFPSKDSVQIWYKPLKADSISVSISRAGLLKDYTVKIKNQNADSLQLTPVQNGSLQLRDNFRVKSSTPLIKFDKTRMSVISKDSSAVAFETSYDEFEQEIKFDFTLEPLDKYTVKMLPGAVTDFFEATNDTLTYRLTTRNSTDYGNVRLILKNARSYPVIVELTDSKGKVLAAETSNGPEVIFDNLEPHEFRMRVIYDTNNNGIWDTGNYLEKRQPEDVIYYPELLKVRANWDVNPEFDLSD